MGLKRWFYKDGRPNRVARFLDRWTAALYALGVAPDYLVTLEVRGRRSGRTVALPLVMVVVGGERYVVSMVGDGANWVRNVRSADGEVAIRHGRREEVRLEEVAVEHRAPLLKAYLKRAPNARAHVPVDKDAPLAEFERVASGFPVFRVALRSKTPGSPLPTTPRPDRRPRSKTRLEGPGLAPIYPSCDGTVRKRFRVCSPVGRALDGPLDPEYCTASVLAPVARRLTRR